MPPISELRHISRREFIKGSAVTGAGGALALSGIEQLIPPPQPEVSLPKVSLENKNSYLWASVAEGFARNLLGQVRQQFSPETAALIAHAFDHTSGAIFQTGKKLIVPDDKGRDAVIQRKNEIYKEAATMFERIADSMLRLGAVKALNKILAEKKRIYSWDEIEMVIGAIFNTPTQGNLPSQPLARFEDYFLDPAAGLGTSILEWSGGTGHKPINWAWRVITREGADIYEGTTTLEGLLNRTINGGEMVMALKMEDYDGEHWWETVRNENIKTDQVQRSWRWFSPKTVFVKCDDATIVPSYY